MRVLLFLIVLSFGTNLCGLAQQPTGQVETSREQYLERRNELSREDMQSAFDGDLLLDSTELILDEKLLLLRNQMIQQYKQQHFFPPARYFFQSKSHIEQTKLYTILQMMPKGGILHLHGAAAGDLDWIVEKVTKTPHAYLYWKPTDDRYTKGQIRFFKDDPPEGFKAAAELVNTVPNLADSLHNLLTFDESIDGDSVDIWGRFEDIFNRIYGFVTYQPMFKPYFRRAFDNLVQDGIQHVELRGIFNSLYDLENNSYTADSTILYFKELEDEIRRKEPAFSLKVIYTYLRFHEPEKVFQQLLNAFELRRRYPDFIVGFDLVAEEDAGYSTLHFLDVWLKLDSLETTYGIDMPLYLHDGESDWVHVENLYDAVLLNSRRIGHGFNLFRFPHLLEEVKRKNICLELNPISNQILGFVRDLRLHPGSTYLRRGVACTINSDDPLIFNYKGLSYDFWEIFLAWELDLRALKKLALNSLIYSSLSTAEQETALVHFNTKWKDFVNHALTLLSDQ